MNWNFIKIWLCFLNLALTNLALAANFSTFSPHKLAHPCPCTTTTSNAHWWLLLLLCSWRRTHLSPCAGWCPCHFPVISKAKVVSRAGSLCGAGRLYLLREPLPGAEVTRVVGDADAFSWWQHCTVTAKYCANPKHFCFEPLHPWGMKRGLENLLHIGFQDLWVWTKENSHSDPYSKFF